MYPRQLAFAWRYIKLLAFGQETVLHALRKQATLRPHEPFLFFDGHWQSWGDFWDRVQQRVNALHSLGAKPGEVSALWMENSPELLQNALAVCQLGGVAALISPDLQGKALTHNLTVSNAKRLVVGASLADAVLESMEELSTLPLTAYWEDAPVALSPKGRQKPACAQWPVLAEQVAQQPKTASFAQVPKADHMALYIHTSGTTGMPKAARITHHRWMGAGLAMGFYAQHLTTDDCLYCPLPLHHSNGMLISFGSTLVTGARFALSKCFSASQFWKEAKASKATTFVYIGELLRYLSQVPPHAAEREHGIRIILGNGLRPDLWEVVQQRFGIPNIREFYASTEGNAVMVNMSNRQGSVGRPLLKVFDNTAIVKRDAIEGQPLRNADGFCVPSPLNEAGEFLGKIRFTTPFHGYTQTEKAQDKVLNNVFKAKDTYFRSGDLMRKDEEGDFFFVDRIGDTFRWKGENVSTQQVEQVLHQLPAIAWANVYGVEVPNTEGRAGMAALILQPDAELDGKQWLRFLQQHLPIYAIPVFLRLMKQLETTATMKLSKKTLQEQGMHPKNIQEALFYADKETTQYLLWDTDCYQRCQQGTLRL